MTAAALASVTVVGLGPGPVELLTAHARAVIAAAPVRLVAAVEHPAVAALLADAVELAGQTPEAVLEAVVEAASEHGAAVYAVAGSPFVLERAVRLLRADDRVDTAVVPALSFLDLAWDRLVVDPVAEAVRTVDAGDLAGRRLDGAVLMASVHDARTLGACRSALAVAGDEAVVVLRRLGWPDETVETTTWDDLDADALDATTCLFRPAGADPVAAGYVRFHQLARTLREECPWDREQTHASLVPYLVEETFELVDALHALDLDDPATEDAVIEELGDVLYQIEFHATLAEQAGRWTIADVTTGIHDKLVRRHPHIFADADAADAGAVVRNWDDIKRAEKARTSVFDGVATSLPALAYTDQLMRKAAKLGFDWPDVDGPFAKLDEEVAELRAAVAQGDAAAMADELGDVVATVVSIARHLGVDAELAGRAAANKFRARFEAVEAFALERGIDLRSAGLDALDALWGEVKSANVSTADEPH